MLQRFAKKMVVFICYDYKDRSANKTKWTLEVILREVVTADQY